MRQLLLAIFIMVLTLPSQAQSSNQDQFQKLWARYEKGENVDLALKNLAKDGQLAKKTRFNAAYLLAVSKLANGEPDEALSALNQAEALVPKTNQVAIRQAEALFAKKDLKAAKKRLKVVKNKVASKKKSSIYRRHQVLSARILAQEGKHKKAIQSLKLLAKSQSKTWETHFFLGRFQEALDKPKESIEAYEKAIKYLPKKDPCLGVYALQRWAALSISSNSGSYGQAKVMTKAKERYQEFLKRAAANDVPEKLIAKTRSAVSALDYFLKK